eukprot:gene8101-5637_t
MLVGALFEVLKLGRTNENNKQQRLPGCFTAFSFLVPLACKFNY